MILGIYIICPKARRVYRKLTETWSVGSSTKFLPGRDIQWKLLIHTMQNVNTWSFLTYVRWLLLNFIKDRNIDEASTSLLNTATLIFQS